MGLKNPTKTTFEMVNPFGGKSTFERMANPFFFLFFFRSFDCYGKFETTIYFYGNLTFLTGTRVAYFSQGKWDEELLFFYYYFFFTPNSILWIFRKRLLVTQTSCLLSSFSCIFTLFLSIFAQICLLYYAYFTYTLVPLIFAPLLFSRPYFSRP